MKSLVSLVKTLVNKQKPLTLPEQHLECLSILEESTANLFLTGKAGTGKSSLIRHFRETTKKNVVVLAPTGLAALNVRGQTIHSFFRLPPRMLQKRDIQRLHNTSVYTNIDTLIIDEASMLRADMLDVLDTFLRLNGRDKNRPFGGLQLVLVGDMYQLPPVVTQEERMYFQQLYETSYFFSADSFSQGEFELREFDTVFRQTDPVFVDILNMVRMGTVSMDVLAPINKQVALTVDKNYLVLCPTNDAAERINEQTLALIHSPQFLYTAVTEGNFPTEERTLPAELELRLKKGARVLFLKNDSAGRWVNGTLGTVSRLTEESIHVRIDETDEEVAVKPDSWENIRYEYDEETGKLAAVPVGKFTQYPLRLAWAITIHKSQGMSFDHVCIDFRRSPFAHGQTYVALSRCRTLRGLRLTRAIYPNDVVVDERITEFHRKIRRT